MLCLYTRHRAAPVTVRILRGLLTLGFAVLMLSTIFRTMRRARRQGEQHV